MNRAERVARFSKPEVMAWQDVAVRVAELTGGRGVQVVYDSVGRGTWDASIRSLAQRGLRVSFGSASGAVPMLDINLLMQGRRTLGSSVLMP